MKYITLLFFFFLISVSSRGWWWGPNILASQTLGWHQGRINSHAPVRHNLHTMCTHGPVHLQANSSSSVLHPSLYSWLSTALAHWWLMVDAMCPQLELFFPTCFYLVLVVDVIHIWVCPHLSFEFSSFAKQQLLEESRLVNWQGF